MQLMTFQDKGSAYNEEYSIKNGILKNDDSVVFTQLLTQEKC